MIPFEADVSISFVRYIRVTTPQTTSDPDVVDLVRYSWPMLVVVV